MSIISDTSNFNADRSSRFASNNLKKANLLPEQREIETSQRASERVCASVPKHIEEWVGLLKIAVRQRQWKVALSHCERILSQEPARFQVCVIRGDALVELGRFSQAEDAFARLVEEFPTRILGYRRLAHLAMRLQQWPVAVERFQTMARLFPNDLSGFVGEVNALIQQESFSTARIRLQAIDTAQLCQLPVLKALAAIGFHTGDWETVIEQVQVFIIQNPTRLPTLLDDEPVFRLFNYLFNRLLDSGEFSIVKELIEELTLRSASAVAIALWQSRIAHREGQYKEAKRYCIQAIQQYPERAAILQLQLAQNAKRALRYDQILFWTRQVQPEASVLFKEATILIAQALIRLEKFDEAKRVTKRLIRQEPSRPIGYSILAETLYYQDRDYEQTLKVCNQAIAKGAISTQVYVCRSLALLALRDWVRAQRTSAQCLRQDPENRVLLMTHAEVLHQTQQYERSIATINRWLRLGNFSPVRSATGHLDVQYLQCDPGYRTEAKEKVSVVMTTYGNDNMLPVAIASILNQTYQNLELIVVDDASKDDTLSFLQTIAAKDNRVSVIHQAQNGGTYVAKNCGISVAKGRYLTFMDADDWLHPQAIERQVDTLQHSDAAGVLYGYLRIDRNGHIEFKPEGPNKTAPIALCFERAPVLSTIGYFDPIRIAADAEYYNRFKTVYGIRRIKRIAFPLLFSQRHEESLTGGGVLKLKWHGPDLACDRYRANFRRWHSQIQQGSTPYLPHPLDVRRFAVPDIMT